VRDCSVCARKRDKLSGSVCANNRSEWDCLVLLVVRIVLVGEDVDFNVDLVLLGMFNVAFFHQDLNVLRDCISWIFVKLFPRDYALSERRFFIFFLYSVSCCLCRLEVLDDVYIPVQVLEN